MDIQTLYNHALAAQRQGRLTEAEGLYRDILARAAVPEAMVNLGNMLARQGRHDEALAVFKRALAARPDFAEALFNRANLLLEMKRADAALADFDRVLALRGDMAGAWNNRGTALRTLQRSAEALASFEQAARLDPRHVHALTNCAIALWDLKRLPEALAALDEALAMAPDFAEALYVRGNVLRGLGRLEEALASYEAALAADPAHPHALNGAALAARMLCDFVRAEALAPALLRNAAEGPALIQPFVLLGYSDDAALMRRCAENYVRRTVTPAAPLAGRSMRYGHDRIRLAYLSADFHTHPTAALLAELFERHDRARFEVTGIAFGPDDGSAMRARLARAFDRFLDVRGESDAQVARMLREAEIDIAIDLNGHTQDARPGIFAHRPAPVQVNYLVYPGTSGAPFMDYILADRIVLPPDRQPFFSETIAYLPGCYQPSDTTRIVPPAPSRRDAGLPEQGFVFCCFNASWKITRPVFAIWMRLLQQVEGSVLWLLDSPAREKLRQTAQAHGIDPGRLVFASHLDPAAHLARHACAGLFLDTLPYNAHTTASDALWAGLPLVTCLGKAFPGRVAASLLHHVGQAELVTEDLRAYEALALALARDPARLTATRQTLMRNRQGTALFDSQRFRLGIEAAYAAMLS